MREEVCSTRVSCDHANSRDDDGLLGGYHLTGCMSSTKIPSPIGEFQTGDDGTARRAGARVSKSREAFGPPKLLHSNEKRAVVEQGGRRLAGPRFFWTLRVLQLDSASRDLPLPGRCPEGQVTRGRLSWDRHVFRNRAERQATGVASPRLAPRLISDGLAGDRLNSLTREVSREVQKGWRDTQATQATLR